MLFTNRSLPSVLSPTTYPTPVVILSGERGAVEVPLSTFVSALPAYKDIFPPFADQWQYWFVIFADTTQTALVMLRDLLTNGYTLGGTTYDCQQVLDILHYGRGSLGVIDSITLPSSSGGASKARRNQVGTGFTRRAPNWDYPNMKDAMLTDETANKCGVCFKTFSYKSVLRNHQVSSHGNSAKMRAILPKYSMRCGFGFRCNLCQKIMKTEKGIMFHLGAVHGVVRTLSEGAVAKVKKNSPVWPAKMKKTSSLGKMKVCSPGSGQIHEGLMGNETQIHEATLGNEIRIHEGLLGNET